MLFELFVLLLSPFIINSYEETQAYTTVYLSGAAYCGKDNYNSMLLAGPATGFVYKETLYDVKTDLQGYIGYIQSQKSIYVVIRGSSSILNWIDDFEVKLVNYDSWPTCNCNVHYGFYRSAQSVANKTVNSVLRLKKKFPEYSVIMTGHSYGAATTQLLGMEIEKYGIDVQIYNYGQPRIGDANYAGFVNTIIDDYWRFTHNKDIVPHLPPIAGLGYLHSCREVFEMVDGDFKVCSKVDCEDPLCSGQYPVSQTNADDHSYYLGHYLDCESSTQMD
jgi:hypothetical protein